jgi:AcrR family transcriptional regulator
MNNKNKPDRRALRTKRQLGQALIELIQEKRFDDITVQNVIDRADVGRSTFYSHFRDKEDLFQQNWEAFLDLLASHINWDKAGDGSFIPAEHLFSHLADVQPFYKSLLRSRKTDWVFKAGVAYLSQKIEVALNARHNEPNPQPELAVPAAILAAFISSELFNLLKWWLDHQMPYSPRQMADYYHQLVTPGVVAFLGKSCPARSV